MAVPEQIPYKEYVANGTTTVFPLEFYCEKQEYLVVTVNDIEPENGQWSLISGAVVFLNAPVNGSKIIIKRNTPLERDTNYQTYNNSFRPEPVNYDFDQIWRKLQELGVADWLLGLRIDKEILDRIAADLYYYALSKQYTDKEVNDLRQYLENLINVITGQADLLPIGDNFILTEDGSTQRELNSSLKEQITTLKMSTPKKNLLWQGNFSAWLMGHANAVSNVQRKQIPAGVTHARRNFEVDTVIQHVNGHYCHHALRITRKVLTSSSAIHNVVINLSPDETIKVSGKRCMLAYHCSHGEDWGGGEITVKVQYSRSLFQPILNDDGTYSTDNNILIQSTHIPDLKAKDEPYHLVFDVPDDAIQIAISVDIPFGSDVADVEDWVELESMKLAISDALCVFEEEAESDIEHKALSRYQSSYPNGVARGSPTEQGALRIISTNTNANYAFVEDVRFNPPMLTAPWFTFQSPTSGTEFRLLNKSTGSNINGQAFGLSEKGVIITNNAVVTSGTLFLCHYTAECLI